MWGGEGGRRRGVRYVYVGGLRGAGGGAPWWAGGCLIAWCGVLVRALKSEP